MGCGGSKAKSEGGAGNNNNNPQQQQQPNKSNETPMSAVGPENPTPAPGSGVTKRTSTANIKKSVESANEDPFGSTTPNGKDGVLGGSAVSFTFGDGSYEPISREEDPAAFMTPATVQIRRRTGVSSEPILPEDAEHFVPRVIPKPVNMMTQLRNAVSNNPLFAAFDTQDLDRVLGAMEQETFPKGTLILKQGEEGLHKFFFLTKGKVDIIKNGNVVATFAVGQAFGELELMYNVKCAATVKALEDIEVYSLDRECYRNTVMMVSIRKRRQYADLLRSVNFLESNLTEYELVNLADAVTAQQFKKDDYVVRYGEEPEYMHIIIKGSVKVVGREQGNLHDVCTLADNECIGELEFMHGHAAVADVIVTSEKLQTVKLNRQHFEMVMGPIKDVLEKKATTAKYNYYQGFTFGMPSSDAVHEEDEGPTTPVLPPPVIQAKPRHGVSDEVMEEEDNATWLPPVYEKSEKDIMVLKTAFDSNPLFSSLDADERRVVINAMKMQEFKKGANVLTEGTEGTQCYYVICTGSVDVTKKGVVVCSFHEGHGFGEMELMYPQPCAATVVVASPSLQVGVIDRATYKRLIMKVSMKRRELYAELLGGLELLNEMTDYEKSTLAEALSSVTYEKGAYIIKYGTLTDWMHIIVEGTVQVMGRDPNTHEPVPVCTFSRGKCIGELEFINGHDAVADCIALTPVKTASLHRRHFEMCLGPVLDVFRKQAKTSDTYTYYQAFNGFSFGEETTPGNTPKSGNLNAPSVTTPGGSHNHDNSPAPPPAAGKARSRGFGVSAQQCEVAADWKPPVFVKKPDEVTLLRNVLTKNPLFRSMEPHDMDVLILALEPCHFKKSQNIMTQGEVGGEHWYIIADGEVEIDKAPLGIVAHFRDGQAFGELELMYSTRTAATVRVTSATLTAFRLDRTTYQAIIMKISTERRELYKKLLGGIEFLQKLDDHQQSTLADALSPATFPVGAVVVEIGHPVEWMHIIVEGVVEVIGKDKKYVCDLGRGEMIGELEFLHKSAVAAAQVVAKTPLRTCKLHRDHFELCMGPLAGFIEEITHTKKYEYYRNQQGK